MRRRRFEPMDGVGALSRGTLARVFWRSLFILASFNPRDMQALGFTFALFPGLRKLYPDPTALETAVRRHLYCRFNCHPYAAAAILGGTLHHEERIARGEEPPERANEFKQALMGPLAAVGDGFFWLSLRPAVGAIGAALALVWSIWAMLAFILFFNFVHLLLRSRYLIIGYHLGDRVLSTLSLTRLPAFRSRLRLLAALGAATAAAYVTATLPVRETGPWGDLVFAWVAFGAAWALLAWGRSSYFVFYALALVTVGAGALFFP